MADVLGVATVAVGGWASGILFALTIGTEPLLYTFPPELFVRSRQLLLRRYEPMMPPLMVTSAVLNLVGAAVASTPTGRVTSLAAGLLFLSVVGISLARNAPINRWVARLDADRLDETWDGGTRRRIWREWNRRRSAVAVAAFVLSLVALASH